MLRDDPNKKPKTGLNWCTLIWTPYGEDDLRLVNEAFGKSHVYNGDGIVDAADYIAWRKFGYRAQQQLAGLARLCLFRPRRDQRQPFDHKLALVWW
jgi:hypothetical protein